MELDFFGILKSMKNTLFAFAFVVMFFSGSLVFAQSTEEDFKRLIEKDFPKLIEEKSSQLIEGEARTNINITSKCTIDGKEVPCAEAASVMKKILLFIRDTIDALLNLLDQLFK